MAVIALALGATAAWAEDNYEMRFVDQAVAATGLSREPAPKGKPISEVRVVTEEIFTKEDLWPSFLNVFHRVTRERIVRQEVLLGPGDAFDERRAGETERNLRRLFIFAVVKLVPLQAADGKVVLLVVTKDRWSLRLNSEFNLVGSLLQYLRLRPTEENLFGNNQQLALDFVLRLDTFTIGEYFQEQRLFGKNLYFGEIANIIFSRETFIPEGTTGTVIFGRPLKSLDQTWGFTVNGDWVVRRRRVFQGPRILSLPYPNEEAPTGSVPWVWDAREGGAEANLALRYGSTWKLDLQGTLGFNTKRYTPPTDRGLSAEEASWLTSRWLPRSEHATFLYAEADLYPNRFEVLRNVDTFELSEDYMLGPLFKVATRWGMPAPLSSDHFLELGATARYRWHFGGNLLTVSVAGQMRFQLSRTPSAAPEDGRTPNEQLAFALNRELLGLAPLPRVNQTVAFELLNYSPPFWGGRFVTRLAGLFRWNDLNNGRTLLGGGNGLRGAAPEQDLGRHYLLANVEYRTRAFELKTIFVGMVFFWDAGSAFDEVPAMTHTLGMGLRILLPQFNADTIRIDFGVVVGGPRPSADRIAASYGQITDLRPAQLGDPLQY